MLAVGIVPVIFAGFLSLYSVTIAHRQNIASIQANLINQKTEEIKRFVLDNALRTLQLRLSTGNLDREFDEKSRELFLRGLMESNPGIVDTSFVNASFLGELGHEISRLSLEFTKLGEEAPLRDFTRLEEFKVASSPDENGENCSEASGKNYIGPVKAKSGGSTVTLAAPVKNPLNCIVAVWVADLNLSNIQNIINTSALGETGYVYVVDQSGRAIANSKTEDGQGLPLNLSDLPIVQKILSGEELLDAVHRQRYESVFGGYVVAAGTFIDELGWGIVAEWPVKEADLVLDNLLRQIMIFSVFALFGVVILSILLANKIVKPIQQLEAGTEVVAKGKFDEPVMIKTGDEIEDLAIAFNKMTEGLKQLQALKDEFVFIAAHELKTPVAAIKGYLSIINDGLAGPVSDKVKEFILKVLNANNRLIRLVEDLLEVARSEAGRIKVDVVKTDIAPVVNETLSELKPLADEKGIQTIYTPLVPMPAILGDNGRIREVLVNLIGNAIKYTTGNGSIEITHDVTNKNLVTHIKDHGLGISKEAQAKLFTKFYRVATKETATISGTGLGLFIVKQIIEKMGGTIWVESEEGKGSTFSFSLPLAQ